MLCGTGVSKGYGIGKAVVLNGGFDYSKTEFTSVKEERLRLENALEILIQETQKAAESLKKSAGENAAEIPLGHLAILKDSLFKNQIFEKIEGGVIAEAAVDLAMTKIYRAFSSSDDEFTRERAEDIKIIKDGILRILTGIKGADLSNLKKGSVLVVKDFTPSIAGKISAENVSAVISETGGYTSHSAILARCMGIPAVMSAKSCTKIISDGDTVIADGFCGRAYVSPAKSEIEAFKRRRSEYMKKNNNTAIVKNSKIKVLGNIQNVKDSCKILQNGGEGIGLFRTEFLITSRMPSEEEQLSAYCEAAKIMGGREVIIRTFDIGGDKIFPCIKRSDEDNALLGVRGIRFCLENTDIFKTQLRAIMRAAYFGNVKICLPFVTLPEEIRKTKILISECESELKSEGLKYKKAPLGVMIETPSAVLVSGLLAREADFFSIGTNDLTEYIMAADRGNTNVSSYYSVFHPSVMSAVKIAVENAKKAGIKACVCGEDAENERFIKALCDFGVDCVSVSSRAIPATLRALNSQLK